MQAHDAVAACNHLRNRQVHLVALDLALPGRPGSELLEEILAICPDVVVLMVSAVSEARTAIDVLRRGASGYLVKPVSREQLILQARRSIAQRQMLIEHRQYTERLERQVRQQTMAIRRAHEETIHRLVAASSCRDVETKMHVLRTGLLAELLARAKGWPPAESEKIRLAAPMHDVGKIGIPDAILRKPSKLTRDEFEIMKRHTTIGASMLDDSRADAADGAADCLEPSRALERRRLSLWAVRPRHPRSGADHGHRRRLRFAHAHPRLPSGDERRGRRWQIIRHGAGKDFDPALLAVFLENLPGVREVEARCPDEVRESAVPGLKCLPRELAALAGPAMA